MHLISVSADVPKWLDPQKSSAPAKLVFTGLVLLVFAVVYLQRRISRMRSRKRARCEGDRPRSAQD